MVTNRYTIPKLKIIFIPTIFELKEFAMRYTKKQWSSLCFNQKFLDVIMEDICKAEELSKEILENKSTTSRLKP